jgi:hypothetical protein
MIIHKPELKEGPNEVVVSAAVESETRAAGQPDALWFAFPKDVGEFVTDGADGFASALLPLAMRRGESLRVHGELSYRLARGLREYQWFQTTWKPDFFRSVALEADSYRSRDPTEAGGAVGAAFSGGVDSFHTLQSHLGVAEPYPPYRISHCLMINGFDPDTDLANTGSFKAIQSLYESMMERLGLKLVAVRTNLLQFLGLSIQKQAFTSFVTSPALVLGGLFSRFYIPSSYKFTHLSRFQDGSHPMFDHLLATESMETIHDGGHLTRVAKTVAISSWPETYDLLRVCFNATGVQPGVPAIANCCNCEKCLRTMTTLHIAGALDHYRCFPRMLEPGDIGRMENGYPGWQVYAEEIIEYAARAGRQDIARNLRLGIAKGVLYRRRLRSLMLASHALEQRSRPYAALVNPAKRLLRRSGMGRGWLY